MIIFLVSTVSISLLMVWQLVVYLRTPQGGGLRHPVLVRIVLLAAVLGLCVYGWRSALMKEVAFLQVLTPYPQSTLNVLETPIFSAAPYWTYSAHATGNEIFNWYRSRSKHAGWTVVEEETPTGRVFLVKISKTVTFFVVLVENKGKTKIVYTTEGSIMRDSVEKN